MLMGCCFLAGWVESAALRAAALFLLLAAFISTAGLGKSPALGWCAAAGVVGAVSAMVTAVVAVQTAKPTSNGMIFFILRSFNRLMHKDCKGNTFLR